MFLPSIIKSAAMSYLPNPISLYFPSVNLPLSFPSLCLSPINLSIHMIDQLTLSLTLENDWPLLMTSFLADLRTFIGRVCKVFLKWAGLQARARGVNVVFCPRCIFTTWRKSNLDIVLLQPSITDDSIQARRLWGGLLGSVIHPVRRSEESRGGERRIRKRKGEGLGREGWRGREAERWGWSGENRK